MKQAVVVWGLCFLLPVFLSAQGTTCGTAISLTLDGVCRTYATSSTSDTARLCSYSGSSPVTYFTFTANSSGQCVLLNITAPTAEPMEVAMFGAACGSMYSAPSMCFTNGQGLWTAGYNFTLVPNTVYKLRIKTTTSGNITICGQYYTSPNDACSGATEISTIFITDNNACAYGGPEVTAPQLCAGTLENTVFYKYTIQNPGISSINIHNINCNNGSGNNSNGMQIGFFTGSCGSLTPVSCVTTTGADVTANTDSLPAGTVVYVALDGVAGSRCQYSINAFNAITLAASIRFFSGWKTPNSNILRWATETEMNNLYFEIQRSTDGINFTGIARVAGEMNSSSEKYYSFEDRNPVAHAYYRLKQVDNNGKFSLSNIIEIRRQDMPSLHIDISNTFSSPVKFQFQANFRADLGLSILNVMGQSVFYDRLTCNKGITTYLPGLSSLPAGKYYLVAEYNDAKVVKSFLIL